MGDFDLTERLITAAEFASMLGVTEDDVLEWMLAGHIPYVEGHRRLISTIQRSTHRIIPAGPRSNPAEDITPTPWQADSHSRYGGTTITPTQLSEQVDR